MTDYLSLGAQHGFQFSLSFYNVGATQRVALASVNEVSSKDDIFSYLAPLQAAQDSQIIK